MSKYLGETKSGSVNGMTFSRNRYGQYVRRHAIPVNPNTEKQRETRSAFAQASSGWVSTTLAQKGAWTEIAKLFPIKDALGNQKVLDGHTFYVKFNTKRILEGLAPQNDISTADIVGPVTDIPGFASGVFSVDSVGGTLGSIWTTQPEVYTELFQNKILFSVSFSVNDWAPFKENSRLVVRVSAPKRGAGQYVSQREMRDVLSFDPKNIGPTSLFTVASTEPTDQPAHMQLYRFTIGIATEPTDDASTRVFYVADQTKRGNWFRAQVVSAGANKIQEEVLADGWFYFA